MWLTALRRYLAFIAVANLGWELAQLPLYTIWRTGSPGQLVFAVVHCTGGDLLIAASALLLALLLIGDAGWPQDRFYPVAALTIALGLGYTIFSEWLNIVVRAAWAYSDLMPVFSIFGTKVGLSPLLQWTVLPALALHTARRAMRFRPGGERGPSFR